MYTKKQLEFHRTYQPSVHLNYKFVYRNEADIRPGQKKFINQLNQYILVKYNETQAQAIIVDGICEALSHLFADQEIPDWEQFCASIFSWDGKKESLVETQENALELLWDYVKKYNLATPPIKIEHQFPGNNLRDYLSTVTDTCLLSNPWHTIAIRRIPQSSFWYLYNCNTSSIGNYISDRNLIEKLHHNLGPLITVQTNKTLVPSITDLDAFIAEGGTIILDDIDNYHSIIDKINNFNQFSKTGLEGLLLKNVEAIPTWADLLVTNRLVMKQVIMKLLFLFIDKFGDSAKALLTKSLNTVEEKFISNLINTLSKENPKDHDQKLKVKIIIQAVNDCVLIKEKKSAKNHLKRVDPMKPKPSITKNTANFFKKSNHHSRKVLNSCLKQSKGRNH